MGGAKRYPSRCASALMGIAALHPSYANTPPRSRGAFRPRFAKILSPRKTRGRRECRVLAAPAVSCAIVREKGAHEHTGAAGAFRHSLRSGFTAYAALSPETNSSCLRRRRIEGQANPGRALLTSGGLTPATGARTTRFCRPQQCFRLARCVRSRKHPPCEHLARPALPRPPHPAPYVRDDRDTPLWRDGMAGILLLICPTG